MQHEWLIDILADLKAFATAKGMEATATALEDASLAFMAETTPCAELAQRPSRAARVGDHDGQSGSVTYLFAERGHA